MTLREFIEQEIRSERISCIEDFGESLDKLESSDGEERSSYRQLEEWLTELKNTREKK